MKIAALLQRRPTVSARREPLTDVALRLVVYAGEAYSLSRSSSGVRVVYGKAWISHAGRDAILTGGEELVLCPTRDVAVVSAMGRAPLVVEVLKRR